VACDCGPPACELDAGEELGCRDRGDHDVVVVPDHVVQRRLRAFGRDEHRRIRSFSRGRWGGLGT
jgi:hypothetical protein